MALQTGIEEENNLVLIVDDMRLNREVLGQMIKEMALEPIFAESGEQAVATYAQSKPGLILMDINMPGMDGIEATREIKKLAANRFVPIIFVSGAEGHEVIRNAIDAGGDDYIQRPFPFELLEGKIVALRRISQLYSQVSHLNRIRAVEEEVAEQLFSGAVESDNAALDQIRIHKQAAETFSGDVQLSAFRPNGDLNVLLGDFTGHGLTTTVGALPLSETFRAMTAKGYDAEDIIVQINRKLHRLLPTSMFLACSVLTLSCDGSVKIWNGGLPEVMVVSQGKITHRIISSSPPLAILSNISNICFEHINLTPDAHILLLSDGVIEAENSQGDMFGEARLESAIASAHNSKYDLIDAILASVYQFVGTHPQKDDISLIDVPGRVFSPAQQCAPSAMSASADAVDETLVLDIWNWSLELQGQSLSRINPVAQALSRLQESEGGNDQWHSVFSILTELYVNALDHGVLKLESSMKSTPEGFAQYFVEREKRLEALTAGTVSLYLQHTRLRNGGRLVIRVEDSGDGFDYEAWKLSSGKNRDGQFSGRGIALVDGLCESIAYHNGGTLVEAVYVYSR